MLSGGRLFRSRLMRRNKMLVRTRRHRVTLSLGNYRARHRRRRFYRWNLLSTLDARAPLLYPFTLRGGV